MPVVAVRAAQDLGVYPDVNSTFRSSVQQRQNHENLYTYIVFLEFEW